MSLAVQYVGRLVGCRLVYCPVVLVGCIVQQIVVYLNAILTPDIIRKLKAKMHINSLQMAINLIIQT